MATRHEPWPATVVTAVAGVLGDTTHGLTGREIGQLLAVVKVPDVDAGNKRDRLAGALLAQQARQGASNCVIAFIKVAMAPVRYVQQPRTFSRRQDDLNEVLVHVGLRVNDQGQVARWPAAATLSEAARHASSLQAELRRRSTHPDVLRYCTLEILAKNPFHASLEAVKSVADRLRQLTGRAWTGRGWSTRCSCRGKGRPGWPSMRTSRGPSWMSRKGAGEPGQGPVQHVPQSGRARAAPAPHGHRRGTAGTAHHTVDGAPTARQRARHPLMPQSVQLVTELH